MWRLALGRSQWIAAVSLRLHMPAAIPLAGGNDGACKHGKDRFAYESSSRVSSMPAVEAFGLDSTGSDSSSSVARLASQPEPSRDGSTLRLLKESSCPIASTTSAYKK
jgi:hypothetical protein